MENNNRESLFANAAKGLSGSIGRFAKDLYSAISENSRLSKDIDKANTSDDYYEDKKETQEKKLNDLLERSQYLNNLISRQFKELIGNLKSFLDSVTGGRGLGVLGGILGLTAASPLLFGDSQVEEIDLSDGDYDPESPAAPRNNNNFEGEPLSDDLAAPLEGAEGVDVEFSPGPRRPNPPSYGVVNAVRNAVFSTFGEGYRIVITSGEGEYGSVRHREESGGAAIDYRIVDPDGNPVSINDSRIRNYLKSLGEQGIKGHGMGREYMGEYTMHSDIVPPDRYTEGMGPTWGDGWGEGLRQTFLNARSGVETPLTGPRVELQEETREDGTVVRMVRLPTLEEFIRELSPEETQIEEEITPTPAQDITGGGSGDDELTGGDNTGGDNSDRLQESKAQDTPEPVTPETPVVEPENDSNRSISLANVGDFFDENGNLIVPHSNTLRDFSLADLTNMGESERVTSDTNEDKSATSVKPADLTNMGESERVTSDTNEDKSATSVKPQDTPLEKDISGNEKVDQTRNRLLRGGGVDDHLKPGADGNKTLDKPTTSDQAPVPETTPSVPGASDTNIEVTKSILVSNPTKIDVADTVTLSSQKTQQTPITDQDQKNPETPQYEQTAWSEPPKTSESIQNFLKRLDYKEEKEQELVYA